MLWRLLSEQEEEEFKQWARDNWEYNSLKDQSTWHPISRMEWARLDYEAVKATNGIQISGEDAAYFAEKKVNNNNYNNNNKNNNNKNNKNKNENRNENNENNENRNENNENRDENKIILNFAEEIPFLTRKMFSGLNNDINWAILVILKNVGDRQLSDLEKITALRRDVLEDHVKQLIDCALIENYVQQKDGELKSFYEITLLALNILNSIDAMTWSDLVD